jgi:hypothetical protein
LAPSRSLQDLARYRAGLRGFPTAPRRYRPSLAEEPESCGPSGLGSPTELSLLPWSNSTSSRGIRPALRSETATCAAARFGRRSPLHRPRNAQARPESFAAERPLPRTLPHASVARRPSSPLVPSSWFRTTSTVSSARRSRACCIPLPVMGFAAFPEPGSRSATWQARSWREGRHLPRDALHTPRRHPRLQPYHVTVAVAPLPLAVDPARPVSSSPLPAPFLRAPHDRGLDSEAFLRRRV